MALEYASARVHVVDDIPEIKVPYPMAEYLRGFARRDQVEVVWQRLTQHDMLLRQEPRFQILWWPFPKNLQSLTFWVHIPLETQVNSLGSVLHFFRENHINIVECRSIDRKPLGDAGAGKEAYGGGQADFLVSIAADRAAEMTEEILQERLAACLELPASTVSVEDVGSPGSGEGGAVQRASNLAVPLLPSWLRDYFSGTHDETNAWNERFRLSAIMRYAEERGEPVIRLLPAEDSAKLGALRSLLRKACPEGTYVNLQFDTQSQVLSAFVKDYRERIVEVHADLVDEPGRLDAIYSTLAALNVDARLINPDYKMYSEAQATERSTRYHINGNVTGSKLRLFDPDTIAEIVRAHFSDEKGGTCSPICVSGNDDSQRILLQFGWPEEGTLRWFRRHKGFNYYPRQQPEALQGSLAIARSDEAFNGSGTSRGEADAGDPRAEVRFDIYNEANEGMHLHLRLKFPELSSDDEEVHGEPRFKRAEIVDLINTSLAEAYAAVRDDMGGEESLSDAALDSVAEEFKRSFYRAASDLIYEHAFLRAAKQLCATVLTDKSKKERFCEESIVARFQFVKGFVDARQTTGTNRISPQILTEANSLLDALESYCQGNERRSRTKQELEELARVLQTTLNGGFKRTDDVKKTLQN